MNIIQNKISHFDTMWMYSITIYSYYVIWAKADNPQNEIQNFSALTFLFSRSIMCWEFKTYVTHVLLHNYSNLLKAFIHLCKYNVCNSRQKCQKNSWKHTSLHYFVWFLDKYMIHEKILASMLNNVRRDLAISIFHFSFQASSWFNYFINSNFKVWHWFMWKFAKRNCILN